MNNTCSIELLSRLTTNCLSQIFSKPQEYKHMTINNNCYINNSVLIILSLEILKFVYAFIQFLICLISQYTVVITVLVVGLRAVHLGHSYININILTQMNCWPCMHTVLHSYLHNNIILTHISNNRCVQ